MYVIIICGDDSGNHHSHTEYMDFLKTTSVMHTKSEDLSPRRIETFQ